MPYFAITNQRHWPHVHARKSSSTAVTGRIVDRGG